MARPELANPSDRDNLRAVFRQTTGTYEDRTDILAETAALPENLVLTDLETGGRYAVAASAATDHHLTTAGGSKLYVLPGSDGAFSVKAFGAVGDGTTDDAAAIQAALDAAAGAPVVIPDGTYDLGGATITPPAGGRIVFAGGVLQNGTIACDNIEITGVAGFSSDIILTGQLRAGAEFDWFVCEKADPADYDTFINGASATFGAAPSISSANRTILKMLIDNDHKVRFGEGIYPFDAEVEITAGRDFRLSGVDLAHTLLWAPNSSFIHYTGGASALPYLRDLAIEALVHVLHTDAWAVNAIRDLQFLNALLISYTDHAFYNDKTTSGGTGCPIYGSIVENCAVHAGPDKGVFKGWNSGSNDYSRVVDAPTFFRGASTAVKGSMRAIFWNSNVRRLCHCNIAYSAFDYVLYIDEYAQWIFNADSNTFETNAGSFKAIVKDEASSRIDINTRANRYIGAPTENGLHYLLTGGNSRIHHTDSPSPLYSSNLQNASGDFIIGMTEPVDVGGTKSRLVFMEPHTLKDDGTQYGTTLIGLDADVAALVGLSDFYAANSATLSYLEVRPSARLEAVRRLAGGYGTTANRPTTMLHKGYPYYDTTLDAPIWWNGSAWRSLAPLSGSKYFDAPSLADGERTTTTITVTGAELGDIVIGVSFSLDIQGIEAWGYVSAADTVTLVLENNTGGAIDLGGGQQYRVKVQKA